MKWKTTLATLSNCGHMTLLGWSLLLLAKLKTDISSLVLCVTLILVGKKSASLLYGQDTVLFFDSSMAVFYRYNRSNLNKLQKNSVPISLLFPQSHFNFSLCKNFFF